MNERSAKGNSLFLLVVLQCFFSVPKAFALSKIPSNLLYQRPNSFISSPKSPLIPPRTSASVVPDMPRGGDNQEEEDTRSIEEIQREALGNIETCYQLAFLAGAVGISSVVWESHQRTSRLWRFNLAEMGDLAVHAFSFVFCGGLFRAHRLFAQLRGDDRMSAPNFLKLSQTLSRLWAGTTFFLSLDSIGMVDDLKIGGTELVGAVGLLFLANLPLGGWYHRSSLAKEEPLPQAPEEYEPARRIGLRAARNMLWCVGSIALSGIVEIIEYTTKTLRAEGMEDKAGEVIGGLFEVSESIIVTGLLASLYKSFSRAIIMGTKRQLSTKDPALRAYYKAQTKFYARVSSFFGFQALFTVLGYAAQIGEKLWFQYVVGK